MQDLFGNKMAGCTKCELSASGINHPCIPPYSSGGPVEIIFIGEAPGKHEDEEGEIFVGKSGKLLRKALYKVGITKGYIITNAVRCRPTTPNDKNRQPTSKEIIACNPKLIAELVKYKDTLKVIVPLGGVALSSLMGLKGIQRFRGNVLRYSNKVAGLSNIPVVPTVHPAFILRKGYREEHEEQLKLFRADLKKVVSVLKGEEIEQPQSKLHEGYKCSRDDSSAISHILQLSKYDRLSFDIETMSKTDSTIVCIGFSWAPGEACCIPVHHSEITLEHKQAIITHLKDLFEDETKTFIAQNVLFDMVELRRQFDIEIQGKVLDTMEMHRLLDETGNNGLESMVWEYFSEYGGYKDRFWKKYSGLLMCNIPLTAMSNYNCTDCDMTFRIAGVVEKQLKKEKMWHLYSEIVSPSVAEGYADLMYYGLAADPVYAKKVERHILKKIKKFEKQMFEFPEVFQCMMRKGASFKFSSNDQMAQILFGLMGLPVITTTESGKAQVDEKVLTVLVDDYNSKFAEVLLKYRKQTKRLNTYVTPIVERRRITTENRIHPRYRFVDTGRTATRDPNLQNIERGSFLRNLYVARPGYILVSPDYSQVELRVMAALSGDENMIKCFMGGGDIHSNTGCGIFGVSVDELTKEQRVKAKGFNFGVLYGRTAHGLVDDRKGFNLDGETTLQQAEEQLQKFLDTYPSIEEVYWKTVIAEALKNGYTTNPFGRRRQLKDLKGMNRRIAEKHFGHAIRQCKNTGIQSTAADILKLAFIAIMREFRQRDWLGWKNIVIPVNENHDALYFEVLRSRAKEVIIVIKRKMESVDLPFMRGIPLVADVAVGKRWGALKDLNVSG